MKEAMDLITNRVSCITFEPATSSSINFVTIVNSADCSSDLGMKGGEQHIYLNSGCFNDGLVMPIHELLNTLGLPKETLHEPNSEDPLSFGDKVKEFTRMRST